MVSVAHIVFFIFLLSYQTDIGASAPISEEIINQNNAESSGIHRFFAIFRIGNSYSSDDKMSHGGIIEISNVKSDDNMSHGRIVVMKQIVNSDARSFLSAEVTTTKSEVSLYTNALISRIAIALATAVLIFTILFIAVWRIWICTAPPNSHLSEEDMAFISSNRMMADGVTNHVRAVPNEYVKTRACINKN